MIMTTEMTFSCHGHWHGLLYMNNIRTLTRWIKSKAITYWHLKCSSPSTDMSFFSWEQFTCIYCDTAAHGHVHGHGHGHCHGHGHGVFILATYPKRKWTTNPNPRNITDNRRHMSSVCIPNISSVLILQKFSWPFQYWWFLLPFYIYFAGFAVPDSRVHFCVVLFMF